jgi:hypothetical protein
VRFVGQLATELLKQSGLADTGLARDQDELAVACESALRPASEVVEVFLSADKRREKLGFCSAPSAAYPQDAIEIRWPENAFKLMGPLVLNDE